MENLINWAGLSEHLAGNKDSRIPKKYEEDVNKLIYYIDSWLNCRELTTKDTIKDEIKREFNQKMIEISMIMEKL